MNISTEDILQCNQSEPLADASERIVDLMNENSVNNNYAVFTNRTDIGKLYTVLNPLYSLLRFIAIFIKIKHFSFQFTGHFKTFLNIT